MSKLNTYVHVHDEDGISHAFGPDDTVPAWAADRITNPDVWAEAPTSASGGMRISDPDSFQATEESSDGEPDDSWTLKELKAFADAEGVDLEGAKSKADILSKLAE